MLPLTAMPLLTHQQIPAAVALAGLPPVALDRYDLHHGHLFFAPGCRQLGILFHAKVRCGRVKQASWMGGLSGVRECCELAMHGTPAPGR